MVVLINQRTKHYIIISVVLFLALFLPLMLRSQAFTTGADDYYYLNYVFGKSTNLDVSNSVGVFIINLLPANIFVIKIIMYMFSLVACLFFYETMRIRFKNYVIVGPLILIAFTFFNVLFIRFEVAVFSLPFLFASLYFMTRYQLNGLGKGILYKSYWNLIFSLLLLLISILIWRFSVVMLVAYIFMSGFDVLVISGVIALVIGWGGRLLMIIIPNLSVSENWPLIGGMFLLLMGFAYLKSARIKENWLSILFLSILTLLNNKFFFLACPLLVINIVMLLNKSTTKQVLTIVLVYSLFLIATPYIIYHSYPTDSTVNLLDMAKQSSLDMNKPLEIQWSLGYFSIWNGFDTNHYGHPQLTKNKDVVLITMTGDKNNEDCNIIEKDKYVKVMNC